MQLDLTVPEINTLLQILGQTPTSSGVWPLAVKIKQQADAQISQQEAAAAALPTPQ